MTTGDTLTSGNGPLAATEPPEGYGPGQGTEGAQEAAEAAQATVYVIEQWFDTEDGDGGWSYVGDVKVPKRSSLKTVFDRALEELQELRPTLASGVRLLRAYQPMDVAEWETVLEAPPAPEPRVVVRPRAS